MNLRLLAIFAGLTAFPILCPAAEDELEIITPEIADITTVDNEIRIPISYVNKSNTAVSVSKVDVRLPKQMDFHSRVKNPILGPFSVEPNETEEKEIIIPEIPFPENRSFLLTPYKQRNITIISTTMDENENSSQIKSSVVVDAFSPLWITIVGGIFGVLLNIGLRFLFRKYKRVVIADDPPIWATISMGFVITMLAIIVFRFTATEAPRLPLALEVKDFYGGIVLGLIFRQTADWIGKIFFPSIFTDETH
jgi:hypothetical protein